MVRNDPGVLRMRVGRKLGRTLYLVTTVDNPDADTFVGIMDTKELAAQVVAMWNAQAGGVPNA